VYDNSVHDNREFLCKDKNGQFYLMMKSGRDLFMKSEDCGVTFLNTDVQPTEYIYTDQLQ